MIYCVNGSEALKKRHLVTSRGTGESHWSAEYIGPRDTSQATSMAPHALVTDMSPNETILPHFHGVAQFQIFPSGAGVMGKTEVRPLMLQYKDHHSAYGPLVAGPHGLTFIALRNRIGDSAPVYLSKPGYREKLKPSKRRNWLSPQLELSTVSVLKHRAEARWENVWDPATIDDEMNAQLLRLGAGQTVAGPDPSRAAGYYVFVVNGSLVHGGQDLGTWSMVVVEPTEAAFNIIAGERGLEALVLEFPKDYE